jgi:uncharacterized hydrophobic protein (TIGR00271 family)
MPSVRWGGYGRPVREAGSTLLRRLGSLARLASPAGRLSDADRDAIATDLFCDGPGELRPYVARLTVLTALSTVIAALGLIGNSPAVVIGAMLVAPLMQPIIGLAAALVLGRPRGELLSFGLIVLTVAEAFAVAVLAGWAVPTFRVITLTPELLARTAPALLDLGIAVAAGAAGAYVTVRPRAGGAIAGAAIAVALVPPLGACGVLLAHGNTSLAGGAFFLFLTNLVGIVLAAVAVFLATGFVRRKETSRARAIAIAIPLLIVLGVAYPLAQRSLNTYRLSSDEADIRSLILPQLRAGGLGIQSLSVIHQAGRVVASIDVAGPETPPAVEPLAEQLAARLGQPVRVILRWTSRQELVADSTAG